MSEINSFSGEYRFLSNFYDAEVEYDGKTYPSTEHAFQAAKTLNYAERNTICNARTAGQAKKLGRIVKLRDDWESIKYDVMLEVVRKKFKHSDLAEKLLATGSAELIEGNTWNDTIWGVCNGRGKNWLGHILMQVRDELNEKAS